MRKSGKPPQLLLRCRSLLRKLRFQRFQPCPQRFILFARKLGHGAHRLELFARHEIHIGKQALSLRLQHGFDFLPHPLRRAGGVGEKTTELVEDAVLGLGHGCCSGWRLSVEHNPSATKSESADLPHLPRLLRGIGIGLAPAHARIPTP